MDADQLKERGIHGLVVNYVDARHELIRIARTLRAESNIPPSQKVDFVLRPIDENNPAQLAADKPTIIAILRCGDFKIDAGFAPTKAMPSALTPLGAVYMSLEGAINTDAEAKRLSAQLAEVDEDLKRVAQKLENESFIGKAPAAVVDQQRARKQDLLEKREKLAKLLEMLKGK